MVVLWRLGLGRWVNLWPRVGGQVMVLVNVGRRTGLRRRTPLNYAIVDGDVYCTAGFGRISDWYKNVAKNPEVEVWLPEGWWAGTATDVSDSQSGLALLRQVLVGSGIASHLAGIHPRSVSDAELSRLTSEYRVLRIQRTEQLSRPGGPGDLMWVWPVATLVLGVLLALR